MIDLKDVGLSDGQSRVYNALLVLGSSSLNSIQEKTGIERRNIYDILNKLIERGFVSYTIEKGIKTYQCTHPNKIKEDIIEKERSLQSLRDEIPNLVAAFNESRPEIRAEVYRGNEAIKSLLEESLNHRKQYWIGGNSGVERTQLKNWFSHWMARRVEKKVIMYDLVDSSTKLKGLPPHDIKKHKKSYYKYCQLPKNLSSPMVILIFGDKVAQILWGDQPFAFVLESNEIRDSFMRYFNHFWVEPW
ncbi:hypothetical protein H6503_06505 [Candidatus Woesearchaeota archaeon]|nr:hypothetical protein [Candidatus Woesearchaeota archaeon]